MKIKDRRKFDALLCKAIPNAYLWFDLHGHEDPEALSQEVAATLCHSAAMWSDPANEVEFNHAFSQILKAVAASDVPSDVARGKVDLWHARNVVEPHTPYNVIIASEMAERAVCEGLEAVMMGDTMGDEARYFGMSRQRVHQMVSQGRDSMAEYLVTFP